MSRRQVLVLTATVPIPDAFGAAARAELDAAGLCAGTPRRLAATAIEVGFLGTLLGAFDLGGLGRRLGAPGPGATGIDANVVPADDRRKRLLLADMDSTIIGVECIDEIADLAGVGPQVAAVTEAAMRGDLDFEGALLGRLALLAGASEDLLARAYAERVRLNPGAEVLVRTMAAAGAHTALVSGGFTYFTERVAAAAGFAEHRANRLEIVAGRLTGAVIGPILGREAKRAALADLAHRLGIGEASAVAVGDGANDLAMVRAAGLGVAYRAKPALASEADARLDHSDLTAILALQGIPETDWQG